MQKEYIVSHAKYGKLTICAIHKFEALNNAWRRLVGHHQPPVVCGINNLHSHWNACKTLNDYEEFNNNLLNSGWSVKEQHATT